MVTHGRHHHKSHRHVELLDQTPDQGDLLDVLASEAGHIGLHDVEELGDHRQHPVEMPGAKGALPTLRGFAGRHDDLRSATVHLLDWRGEDHLNTARASQRAVALEIPWIAVEIAAGSE